MMKENKLQFVSSRWIVFGAICLLMPSANADEPERPIPMVDSVRPIPMVEPAKVPNGTVHVELKDGSYLLGKVDVDRTYLLTMGVGEVNITARKVISFEFMDNQSVRIRSLGGDIYSGKLDVDSFAIEFAWGKIEIPTKHIKLVVSQSHVAKAPLALRPVIEIGPDGRVTTSFIDERDYHAFEDNDSHAFTDIADDLNAARTGSAN